MKKWIDFSEITGGFTHFRYYRFWVKTQTEEPYPFPLKPIDSYPFPVLPVLGKNPIVFRSRGVMQRFQGKLLEKKYQPDFICYGEVIIEIKAIRGLTGLEESQLITYLRAAEFKVGLLINFGTTS